MNRSNKNIKRINKTINQIQEQYNLDNWDTKLIKELKRRIQSNPKLIITSIKKVSASGMSRVITYNYFDKENNLRCIDSLISNICGYKQDKKTWGLTVGGCGMDMIFAVLNNFYRCLGISSKDTPYLASKYSRV